MRAALEQLEKELRRRWSQAGSRRSWIEATLVRALSRLPPGPWTVRHPPDWPETERAEFHRDLSSRGDRKPVEFQSDESILAGIEISSGRTSLDATVQGLLADTQAVEAELLARLVEGEVP